jgi:hypothetical protein
MNAHMARKAVNAAAEREEHLAGLPVYGRFNARIGVVAVVAIAESVVGVGLA